MRGGWWLGGVGVRGVGEGGWSSVWGIWGMRGVRRGWLEFVAVGSAAWVAWVAWVTRFGWRKVGGVSGAK